MKTSNPNDQDQINTGIHFLLRYPSLYLLFQYVMGSRHKYRMYINEFMELSVGKRILDIGCGTADILNYLPDNVEYVGYDMSSNYISYAKKRFRERAKFKNERVNEMTPINDEPFDIILADGLLHHLNDDEAKTLFEIGYAMLNDEGFMLTVDPTFVEGQGMFDKYVTSMDRGRHVRTPEGYIDVAQQVFPNVNMSTRLFKMFIPLSGCILKCYKNGDSNA